MPKKSHEDLIESWLRQKLRRLSYQWPPRKEARIASRVSRGKYECAKCKELGVETLYGPKEIVMDHIDPVIDVETGFINWDTYIQRLFCEAEGFQTLCKGCHEIKTYLENQIRVETRAEIAQEKLKKNKKKLDNDDDI